MIGVGNSESGLAAFSRQTFVQNSATRLIILNKKQNKMTMESELNEYCLNYIFSYLKPHDLIHVSQVCKLWKLATSKQWMSITELRTFGYPIDDATILSAVDARKIVLCAAPFVKLLRTESRDLPGMTRYISVGQYYYGAKNFSLANVLNLLSKKSTELTEIDFEEQPPKAHLVRPLFKNNSITKIRYKDQSKFGWHLDIPTHGIVELDVCFEHFIPNLASFRKRFPNLKKLSLEIEQSEVRENPRYMLYQILPHVTGIKTLNLAIISRVNEFDYPDYYISHTVFSDITELSELEELNLELINYDLESPELFFNQLPECCPKLQVLKLGKIELDEVSTKKLLSIPRLKTFYCPGSYGIPGDDSPEMKHLMKLSLYLDARHFDKFVKAVRKMPRLEKLFINHADDVEEIELKRLVCGVVEVATSQGKDVLITTSYDYTYKECPTKQLRVKKSSHQQASEMLEQSLKFTFFYYKYDKNRLFEHVAAFVRNKLHYYDTFVFEGIHG